MYVDNIWMYVYFKFNISFAGSSLFMPMLKSDCKKTTLTSVTIRLFVKH